MSWHYLKDGTQLGPITDEDLLAKVAASEISVDDLVWSEGMDDWLPAGEVVEFEDANSSDANPLSETGKAPDLSNEEWHATIGGEQQGPYTFQELGALYKNRTLSKEDLIWSKLLGDWKPAGEVDAFIPFKPVGLAAPPKPARKTKAARGAKKKKTIAVKKTKINTSTKSKVAGITSGGAATQDSPSTAQPAASKTTSTAATTKAAAATPAGTDDNIQPYEPPQAAMQSSGPSAGGQVSGDLIRELEGTQTWVRLMSILTFIPGILMLVGAGIFLVITIIGIVKGGIAGALGLIPVLLYGALGLLMLYPARKLWGYASSIQRLRTSKSHRDLHEALSMQRKYWKFIGILTVVYFVFAVVMAIASIIFPALVVGLRP